MINTGGRYHLNPDLLDIDVWRLVDALRQAGAATDPTARINALQQVVDADTGDLSAGFDYDWIDRPREQLRRQGFRARLHLADLLAGTDPRQAADLAKAAATLEPYNRGVAGSRHAPTSQVDLCRCLRLTAAEQIVVDQAWVVRGQDLGDQLGQPGAGAFEFGRRYQVPRRDAGRVAVQLLLCDIADVIGPVSAYGMS
ncbi:hypothetical protein [Phytohabitans suffuscus]|uniref:Uncharacterized protein n=1 Tax=Phytohabitans suffuscus TaxID=624315 RepID=A0A6F8YT93_9ACTN|nr:hypothetical protein [Phytohabitans suffuscus]BCB89332.1 hypothetical protein Psuf_066450 [Phytohabitans suffuscus]